jgi:exopolysaccharide biosynthesis polyprenyl glycosylphosphotransferase
MVDLGLPPRSSTRSAPVAPTARTSALAAGRRRHGLNSPAYTTSLVITDYVVAWASLVTGLVLLSTFSRNKVNHISNLWSNVQHGFWFPVGVVLGFAFTGAYRLSRRSPTQSTFSELKDFAMSCCFGGFIALSMSYAAHHFGKWTIQAATQIVVAVVVGTFLIAVAHATLRYVVLRHRPERVAVVDDGANFQRIATHLHLEHGLVLVGRIDAGTVLSDESLGTINRIDEIVSRYRLDRIVFGTVSITPEVEYGYRRASEIADTALVPGMYEVISWRSRLTELSGLPLLELAPRHWSGYDRALKRLFDLAVSVTALTLTLPFTVLIALLVKVTSRGPVFYRQVRLGKDRRPFTIVKFRTMRDELAESKHHPDPLGAVVDDEPDYGTGRTPLHVTRDKAVHHSRLTPIGSFLRRTGLDEIPQFLNVLVGSMSVVGPRPFVTAENERHSPWSARRFEVRPGITGLWQVSGRNNLTEDELRQLDYLYVSAWSMWWDLKICFDTPRAMFRGLGAY